MLIDGLSRETFFILSLEIALKYSIARQIIATALTIKVFEYPVCAVDQLIIG
jgi:hypothetical protein